MPVYNTDPSALRKAIESVQKQVHQNWELICVDDCSTKKEPDEILREAAKDPRIKYLKLEKNSGISKATNHGASQASGEILCFLDHDDELVPHALCTVAARFSKNPQVNVVYSNHDKMDRLGKLSEPMIKGPWDPEWILTFNYTCHFFALRRALFNEIGGLRPEYDHAQDHDLILRLSETQNARTIDSIDDVLYHWRMLPASTASGAQGAHTRNPHLKAIADHLQRKGVAATVTCHPIFSVYKIDFPAAQTQCTTFTISNADDFRKLSTSTSQLQNEDLLILTRPGVLPLSDKDFQEMTSNLNRMEIGGFSPTILDQKNRVHYAGLFGDEIDTWTPRDRLWFDYELTRIHQRSVRQLSPFCFGTKVGIWKKFSKVHTYPIESLAQLAKVFSEYLEHDRLRKIWSPHSKFKLNHL